MSNLVEFGSRAGRGVGNARRTAQRKTGEAARATGRAFAWTSRRAGEAAGWTGRAGLKVTGAQAASRLYAGIIEARHGGNGVNQLGWGLNRASQWEASAAALLAAGDEKGAEVAEKEAKRIRARLDRQVRRERGQLRSLERWGAAGAVDRYMQNVRETAATSEAASARPPATVVDIGTAAVGGFYDDYADYGDDQWGNFGDPYRSGGAYEDPHS